MEDKDKIEIEGKENIIEVKGGHKEVEIEGDKNLIKINGNVGEIEVEGDKNKIEISDSEEKINIKEESIKVFNFFKAKKWQLIFIGLLLLAIVISGSWIRLQNLPLLIDQTSGEYIPLALDPFHFLRVAETMIKGGLPETDVMRYPSLGLEFTNELTPMAVVFLYKVSNIFGDYSIQYIDVLSPVIFFILGLIVFFFLLYSLTNSKWIALLGSAFLAFTPAYLYRTTAGFADHESIGMFAFFSVMLVYSLSLKYLEKEKLNYIKTTLFSISVAFLTFFTVASWGGAVRFVFMIIPLSFFLVWVIKFRKDINLDYMKQSLLFYLLWVIATIIFGLIFNYGFSEMIGNITSSSGIIGSFVFGFVFVDYLLYYTISKGYLKDERLHRYRIFFSCLGTIILGIIMLPLMGKNIIEILSRIWSILLQPFGTDRISLTVAENAQPYLTSWISQIGKFLFWLSSLGIVLIGIELGRKISKKKYKILFSFIWVLFISGILFSRYSPTSVLNGESFVSKGFYLLGIILFLIYSIKIYLNSEIKLDSQIILFASFMLISVIAVRSASRVFFFIAPFACLSASFFVIRIGHYIKGSKDELLRWFLILLLILAIIGSAQILYTSFNTTKIQAKHTGPSANAQWQNSMAWVRNNTDEGKNFIHWWDYGYWVQYLGERPTITDGGHGNTFWDHLIGRYVLTTQKPETALSFMKSHEVDYLLIDQTDLGKYPAYSKIGGDENFDTFSVITTGVIDDKQTMETADTIRRVYNIGGVVDEDFVYEENGQKVFIPGPVFDEIGQSSFKAYVGGIVIESSTNPIGESFKQPHGIFIYNNQQIIIPLKYLYSQGKIFEFEKGLDSIAYLLPKINQDSQGMVNVDPLGAVIYLSPKVSKSLFAQLYLLDDVFENYPTIKLANVESEPVIKSLQSQGMNFGEFVYFNGFRGPIKIWEVNYPANIVAHEEFTRVSGEYAEFDYLFL